MPRSLELYLYDMQKAGQNILTFTRSRTFADYVEDPMLRAAVERQFEIIGEAVAQAKSLYPDELASSTLERRIVDFRNRIIHGYFDVNDEVVWSTLKVYLPPFLVQVDHLLGQARSGDTL